MSKEKDLQKIIDYCGAEQPTDTKVIAVNELLLRGYLLSMPFLKKFFGDKIIGHRETAREGVVESRTPLFMWQEGGRVAVVQDDLIKFYLGHIKSAEKMKEALAKKK